MLIDMLQWVRVTFGTGKWRASKAWLRSAKTKRFDLISETSDPANDMKIIKKF